MKIDQIITYSLKSFDPIYGSVVLFNGIKHPDSVEFLLSGFTLNAKDGTRMTLTKTLHLINPEKQTVLNTQEEKHLHFYVMNDLQYAKDIRKTLIDKYGSTLNFSPNANLEKTPLIITSINKRTGTGMRMNQLSPASKFVFIRVNWRVLEDNDIVVNNKLEQLWPTKSGIIPAKLTDFIKQKTY